MGKFWRRLSRKHHDQIPVTFVVPVTVLVRNHPVVFRKEKQCRGGVVKRASVLNLK